MSNLTNRRCASIASLMTIKDVTREDAEAIRTAWKTARSRSEARMAVDKLLRTHGVEYLGVHKRTGQEVWYCNAGDPYASTVIFSGLSMRVDCWGDFVERGAMETEATGY